MQPGKCTRGHFKEEGPVDWIYYFSMLFSTHILENPPFTARIPRIAKIEAQVQVPEAESCGQQDLAG